MAGGYEQVVLNADTPFEEGAFQPRFVMSMFKGTEKQKMQQAQYMNHLVNARNVPVKHAMGILANIFGESTYDPSSVGDDGKSFGLFQWKDERGKRMKKWVNKGREEDAWKTDWRGQLDYILKEHEPWADGGQSLDTFYSRYEEYLEKNPNATVNDASDYLVDHNLGPLDKPGAKKKRQEHLSGITKTVTSQIKVTDDPLRNYNQ